MNAIFNFILRKRKIILLLGFFYFIYLIFYNILDIYLIIWIYHLSFTINFLFNLIWLDKQQYYILFLIYFIPEIIIFLRKIINRLF